MNLLRSISDFFRQRGPSSLRNKPQGLAWTRGFTGDEAVLNGHVVQTVSVRQGFWSIEPQPPFVVSRYMLTIDGRIACPGERCLVIEIHDDNLEPIPDTGVTKEEVAELYAPKLKESA